MTKNKHHQDLQKYLMASYLYYVQMESVMSDHDFDALGKSLLENYAAWQDHRHAFMVSKGDLQAGTLYTLKENDYPEMVKQAATMWMRQSLD